MRRKLHLTALEDRANPSRWMGDFNGPVQPPEQLREQIMNYEPFTGPVLPPDFNENAEPLVYMTFDDPPPQPLPTPWPPVITPRVFPLAERVNVQLPWNNCAVLLPPGHDPLTPVGISFPCFYPLPPSAFPLPPVPHSTSDIVQWFPDLPPIATPYEPPAPEPVDLTEVWICGNSLISH